MTDKIERSEMPRGITLIAELKKWVKDRINFLRGLGFISTAGLEKSKALVLELNFVLEKINELEAYWKKQKNQFITGDLRKMLLDEMLGDDKSG